MTSLTRWISCDVSILDRLAPESADEGFEVFFRTYLLEVCLGCGEASFDVEAFGHGCM